MAAVWWLLDGRYALPIWIAQGSVAQAVGLQLLMTEISWFTDIIGNIPLSFFRKLKVELPWQAAIHGVTGSRTGLSDWTELNRTDDTAILGCIFEEKENTNSKEISTLMFTAALFTIVKIWKQPKNQSANVYNGNNIPSYKRKKFCHLKEHRWTERVLYLMKFVWQRKTNIVCYHL